MKWRRTYEENTFELDGAEAVSDCYRKSGKIILYQICKFSVKENKGMCENCKVSLYLMLGYDDEIYSPDLSRHLELGKYKTIKQAKDAAEQFEKFMQVW
jgi:hypothetical protein